MLPKKVKKRAYLLAIFLLASMLGVFLILNTLNKNILYFNSPTDIKISQDLNYNKKIRIGGMVKKNTLEINNQEIKTYTFKQDYFWMMGDNRHNSEDSRSWGFVPEDHIIGKPVFIWMSIDGFMDGISNWKPRWNRIFSTVGGEGERKSYFGYFIGLLIIWQVLVFVRKRRKTN